MTITTDGLAPFDADKVQATVQLWEITRDNDERVKRYVEYANGDVRFAIWLYMCDRSCLARVQLSIFDLADACWRDKFDSGTRPRDAVTEALEDDDLFDVAELTDDALDDGE